MKSAPQQSVTALSASKRVLLFVVLVAAGLAGNYLHYEFFFGIQFIFGSIFAMLALLFLGIGPGMLAGAIISSYTYILLNHPYTIVVMTAEVLAVGLLVRRRRTGFVLADALYWLFIGMPLVFLFYHNVMHLPLHNAVVSMLKQGTNGIANALIARLLFTAGAARWKFELISMREALFNILALFCLLPSLFLIARASHDELAEIEQSVRDGLLLSGQRTEKMVNTWLDQRIKTVEHLAWMAANMPAAIMQKHIEYMQGNDQGFLRMGLLNREATIVAYSPPIDELGQSNIGRNFKDRLFISVLKKTLQPMLSEVVMGRIGVPKPMATALAPVVVKGQYAGYMTGILNLEQIDALIGDISRASTLPGREYVLLDKNSKVILSSRKDRKVMEVYSREPGDDVKLDQNIRLWIPAGARNVAVSDRWKKARYHMEIPLGGISGWRLVLEQPLAPFQKLLYERYTAQFAWMLGIVLAALVIADFMSRRTTAPLGALGGLSSGLPEKLMKRETIRWPESTIQETSALIGNFQTMSRTLEEQFGAVQRMNVELERRVDERTRELRESEERFRSLIENTSDWIWEIDEKARYTYTSPRVRDILGYEPREVIGRRPFDFMSPEEAQRVSAEFGAVVGARRPIVSMQNVNIRKDGRTRILETSGVPIIDAEGRFTGYRGIDRDITDRKRSEEALRRGEADLKEAQNIARLGRWDLDLLNDSLQWSDMIYDIFELDKKKFGATYEAFLDAVHPDDRESVNTAYRDSLNNRQPYTITHRLLMRDGRVKWVHEICRTDYDERRRPVRSVGIVQDITERKIAELELRDKTLQLETLTRNLERRVEQEVALRRSNEQMMVQQSKMAAMGQMLGAIAHQWRQPLNVLGLIIQNLEDAHAHGDLDAAYLEKTVEKSMAQIERMSKTIDDFRNFFLPDKERNVFDTVQAAGHAISLFAAQLSASGIDFQLACRTHGKNFTRVEDIIPCQEKSVNGFRNEFEHVMMNLLNNAREAIIERRERGDMPERERGRISFEFQNAGGKIFIEVRDNGGGIPEDVIGRVFEPYFTTKDPAKGTGLGLYMSAVIIEEHMQGRLTVKNSGEGAAFTIELPQA